MVVQICKVPVKRNLRYTIQRTDHLEEGVGRQSHLLWGSYIHFSFQVTFDLYIRLCNVSCVCFHMVHIWSNKHCQAFWGSLLRRSPCANLSSPFVGIMLSYQTDFTTKSLLWKLKFVHKPRSKDSLPSRNFRPIHNQERPIGYPTVQLFFSWAFKSFGNIWFRFLTRDWELWLWIDRYCCAIG